jgi:hypothetical protein
MAEFVYKPDKTIKYLATQALEIQDACNLVAVAGLLGRVTSQLLRHPESSGSEWVRYCPVTRALLNKLNDLALLEQSRTECFTQCMSLRDAEPVKLFIPDPLSREQRDVVRKRFQGLFSLNDDELDLIVGQPAYQGAETRLVIEQPGEVDYERLLDALQFNLQEDVGLSVENWVDEMITAAEAAEN